MGIISLLFFSGGSSFILRLPAPFGKLPQRRLLRARRLKFVHAAKIIKEVFDQELKSGGAQVSEKKLQEMHDQFTQVYEKTTGLTLLGENDTDALKERKRASIRTITGRKREGGEEDTTEATRQYAMVLRCLFMVHLERALLQQESEGVALGHYLDMLGRLQPFQKTAFDDYKHNVLELRVQILNELNARSKTEMKIIQNSSCASVMGIVKQNRFYWVEALTHALHGRRKSRRLRALRRRTRRESL